MPPGLAIDGTDAPIAYGSLAATLLPVDKSDPISIYSGTVAFRLPLPLPLR